MQEGYYYPWKSTIAPLNGEDAYLDLVRKHVSLQKDILDVGCGHGEVALELAPSCRSVLAYDRVLPYIQLAQDAAKQKDIHNIKFLYADSSAKVHDRPTIPSESNSFDLIISRRGPLHWIEDARRVVRKGAVLIQLNPMETPAPSWNNELPLALRRDDNGKESIRRSVERRLSLGRLELHSCWTFDVPETFSDVEQFYLFLTWGYAADETAAFSDVWSELEGIFAKHARRDGLVVRHRRFLWKALIE